MDVLPSGNIFHELQVVHDTGYYDGKVSPEEHWQQVGHLTLILLSIQIQFGWKIIYIYIHMYVYIYVILMYQLLSQIFTYLFLH